MGYVLIIIGTIIDKRHFVILKRGANHYRKARHGWRRARNERATAGILSKYFSAITSIARRFAAAKNYRPPPPLRGKCAETRAARNDRNYRDIPAEKSRLYPNAVKQRSASLSHSPSRPLLPSPSLAPSREIWIFTNALANKTNGISRWEGRPLGRGCKIILAE